MDLGGGSTQIVFEPNQTPISPPLPSDPKYKYDLDFNRIQYSLYQQSYLNYGLNEARRRIKQAAVVKSPSDPGIDSTLACLPKDVTLQVKVPVPSPHDDVASGHVETSLKGSGLGFDACRQFIKSHLLDKKAACDVSPCSFDGVFQVRRLEWKEEEVGGGGGGQSTNA